MQPGDTIEPKTSDDTSAISAAEVKTSKDGEMPPTQLSNEHKPSIAEIESSIKDSASNPESVPKPDINEANDTVSSNSPDSQEAGWKYSATPNSPNPATDTAPIVWTASEFIDHEKSGSWFLGLTGVTILVLAFVYFLTRDVITSLAIAVAAGLFGVTAKRKPHILQYELSNMGIRAGDKFYEYNAFKSFSIIDEDHFRSIQLTPLSRFALPISLYYPPEGEVEITTMIGNYLPHETRKPDIVDRLMHKVRF